jgi:hypothetical protein
MGAVLNMIKGDTVDSQEKYGFTVKDGQQEVQFGPFDTEDAASKTAKALADSGLTVEKVKVIWTVSTARSLATVRRAKMAPPADQKPETKKATEAAPA